MPPRRRDARIPISFDELGAPATRALQAAGFNTLGQLARSTETQVAALHGVGPKAIRLLREQLRVHKLKFAR